jgi:HNH endonuclease/NUMOD3 motif-containing protein
MTEESKRVNVLISCACGKCDLKILKYDTHNGWEERKYARGHATKGKPHSEEHKRRITEAKIGHEVSVETRKKLSLAFKGKPISEQHKKNIGLANIGEKNASWKGGRIKDSRGYWRIWSPTHPFKDYYGYVFEHRLVMEKHLGRYITREELVHHINEIKTDNRIENLRLMTREEHSKLHFKNKNIDLFLKILEIMDFDD